MAPLILFAVIAGLPVLNTLLLRVNAVFVFTAIAVGNFLVLYLSDDVVLAINAFSKAGSIPMIVQLVLLSLPMILTLIFLRKTMPTSKLLFHLIPTIGCGLMFAVLVVPILSSSLQAQIFSIPFGDIFKNSQDLIVSVTSILILLLMWHTYKHKEAKHKKGHHH